MEQTKTELIEKIRSEYEPHEKTSLDELKELDKKVRRPASVVAYVYGSLSSLVLGTGMCLAMKVIGSSMPLGIAIGLVGIGLVSSTYPLYKAILSKRKKKYAEKVIALSSRLLNE